MSRYRYSLKFTTQQAFENHLDMLRFKIPSNQYKFLEELKITLFCIEQFNNHILDRIQFISREGISVKQDDKVLLELRKYIDLLQESYRDRDTLLRVVELILTEDIISEFLYKEEVNE